MYQVKNAPSTHADHMLTELLFFWANFWPETSTAKHRTAEAMGEHSQRLQMSYRQKAAGVHPWKPLPEHQSSQIQLALKTFTNTKYTAKPFGKNIHLKHLRGDRPAELKPKAPDKRQYSQPSALSLNYIYQLLTPLSQWHAVWRQDDSYQTISFTCWQK